MRVYGLKSSFYFIMCEHFFPVSMETQLIGQPCYPQHITLCKSYGSSKSSQWNGIYLPVWIKLMDKIHKHGQPGPKHHQQKQ